jgi:hypothetical protein
MAPKVMRDMPKERHESSLAQKQEVSFVDFVATLKQLKPDKSPKLDDYLEKYKAGTLQGPGAYTCAKLVVGQETCKAAFEKLSPGYKREWAPEEHEHPPVV